MGCGEEHSERGEHPLTLLRGGGVPTLPPTLLLLLPVEGGAEPVGDHHVHVALDRGVARGDGLGAERSGGAAVHTQRGSD